MLSLAKRTEITRSIWGYLMRGDEEGLREYRAHLKNDEKKYARGRIGALRAESEGRYCQRVKVGR
jgi:hypothetical protein